MEKSYLIWLRRPGVRIKLKSGTEIDVVVKVVSQSKNRGTPYILVGHLRTDERPWDQAQRRHPIGRRETCKIVEFVPGGAIVAFESKFWAWLYDAELSWAEPKKALDLFRRDQRVDVVIVAADQEKRRLHVSYRLGLPKPVGAAKEASPPLSAVMSPDPRITDEAIPRGVLIEGAVCLVELNAYERNAAARSACLAHYGTRCVICGFDFVAVYGPHAEGIIHVHHLTPLAKIGEAHVVDPIEDLRPVCPNCHAVIHVGGGTLEIDEVKRMITEATTHQ